jgi:hypothetical protein
MMTTIMALSALACVLACAWLFKRNRGTLLMCNTYNAPNAGRNNCGVKTMLADAAITRGMVVKFGTDEDHVAVTSAATSVPIGIALDTADAAEDPVSIALLGAYTGTLKVVAGAAITIDDWVQGTTAGVAITWAATGYCVGHALQAAQAAGDIIEIAPVVDPVVHA